MMMNISNWYVISILLIKSGAVQCCTLESVVKDVFIPWKSDTQNITVSTNSTAGSDIERVHVQFYDENINYAGGVHISLYTQLEYKLTNCSYYESFPVTLPTETHKTWTLTYNYTEKRVVLQCNGVEVLNVVVSDSVCTGYSYWREYWERKPTQIQFPSGYTASERYCIYSNSECTSLDPTWDYLNTETSFPIVFGTVVEITCETGYSLQGSNTVTCDIGTTYKFVEQPACKLLECTGLDPTWDYMNTETPFPIVFGTLVKVICETGYELKGSNTIACDRDSTFKFVEQPACQETDIGLNQLIPWFLFCGVVFILVVVILGLIIAKIRRTRGQVITDDHLCIRNGNRVECRSNQEDHFYIMDDIDE